MAQEYSSSELMAAIVDLRDATGAALNSLRSEMNHRFEALRHEMNKRFDTVDDRFDSLEHRIAGAP